MCTAHLIRLAVRRAMLAVTRSQTQGLNAIHRVAWSVSLNIAFAGTALAADLPTGGSITSGAGNISQSADALTINQSSSRLNIDWQAFSIGKDHSVTFVQPGSSAVAFNRVTGSEVSSIQGALNANGQVFLSNPNGVLFTPTAQVSVGGILATTLGISDDGNSNGGDKYSLRGSSDKAVIQQGRITAGEGGSVVLVAAQVSNTGAIDAHGGTVLVGAGNGVTLDFGGPVKIRVDDGALNALVEQGGAIRADGGVVYLTAKAAGSLGTAAINHTGLTQARSLSTNEKGEIVLLGDMDHGTLNVAGTLDASSAAGTADGGFIETSAAHVSIADDVHVTTASNNGHSGTWLIDPNDFTIAASGGNITGAALTTALSSSDVQISTALQGTTGGNGDIFVNDRVNWSANTLTLSAGRNIQINARLNGSGTAGLALEYGQAAVAAGNTASYSVDAPVYLASTGSFSTKLGSDGSPLDYTIITSLGAPGSTTGTDLQGIDGDLNGHYVLGTDIDASATAGWNSGAGFSSIGRSSLAIFRGTFDGLGHSISNLTINRPSTPNVGLFSVALNASLRNLGLDGGSIAGGLEVGALVGTRSDGEVRNVYATSTVSGTDFNVGGLIGSNDGGTVSDVYTTGAVSSSSSSVGGVIGFNSGSTLSNVRATGAVSGSNYVGGLVGYATGAGTISNAYATGVVSGNGSVGGLVGWSLGSVSISNAYATGAVWGNNVVGGLVGSSSSSGAITNAYATGAVSGFNDVGGFAGNAIGGTFSNVYATGMVSGNSLVGGLVGITSGTTIDNTYATGAVSGNSTTGGLIGSNVGAITNSYSTGRVTGNISIGGFAGDNSIGTIGSSYWATDSSGVSVGVGSSNSAGLTGLTLAQLSTAMPAGFSSTAWGNAGNQTTPFLLGLEGNLVHIADDSDPAHFYTVIQNVDQLQNAQRALDGHYVLGNDIDASGTVRWNAGKGFEPIGASGNSFTGVFNGLGFHVSDLTINRPLDTGVGLFGFASNATIQNVGLEGASITGDAYVGALVGFNGASTVNNAYATGAVSGDIAFVGGLIGYNDSGTISNAHTAVTVSANVSAVGGLLGYNGGGTLTNVYATGAVSAGYNYVGGLVGDTLGGTISNAYATGDVQAGGQDVGGLIGANESVSLTNVYATGSVSGNDYVGGLIGYQFSGTVDNAYAIGAVSGNFSGGLIGSSNNTATIGNAYWATDTSGYSSSAGGEGKTLAELKQLSTFAAWGTDIDAQGGTGSVWRIYEGDTTPLLRSYLTGLTVTANDASKTYDAVAWSDGNGVSYSVAPNSNLLGMLSYGGAAQGSVNAGNYALSAQGLYSHQQGYDITFIDGTLSVAKAALSLNAVTQTRTYDGTTASATAVQVVGLQGSDAVTGLTQSFDSRNAGSRTLIIDGEYVIDDGNGGNNYTVTTHTAAGTINKATLAIGAVSDSKTYSGTTASNGSVQTSGLVSGDMVTGLTQSFDSRNAGSRTLAVNGGYVVNDGNGGNNYVITTSTATGTINKAALAINAVSDSKRYDGTAASNGSVQTSGLISGDTISGVKQSFDDAQVGDRTLAVDVGYTVNDGNGGNNYLVTTTTASGRIVAASVPAFDGAISELQQVDDEDAEEQKAEGPPEPIEPLVEVKGTGVRAP